MDCTSRLTVCHNEGTHHSATVKALAPVDFKAVAAKGCFVYCYLRANDSATAKAGTPYYVGVASFAARPFEKHTCGVPKKRPELVRVLKAGLDRDSACDWERLFIAHYGRKDNGTGVLENRTDGGDGCGNPSEAHRQAMGSGMRGKRQTEEHVQLRVEARKRNGTTGHTEEARKKMSQSHSGKTLSVGHRAAIGESSKRVANERGAQELGITVEQFQALTQKQRFSMRRFLAKFPFITGPQYLAMSKSERMSLSAQHRGMDTVTAA